MQISMTPLGLIHCLLNKTHSVEISHLLSQYTPQHSNPEFLIVGFHENFNFNRISLKCSNSVQVDFTYTHGQFLSHKAMGNTNSSKHCDQ